MYNYLGAFSGVAEQWMTSTGIVDLDEILGSEGYPDRSAILITGPPGIGKEGLGYWFTKEGLDRGDLCLYVTRVSVREIKRDQKAFGLTASNFSPRWFARDGGEIKVDVKDLGHLSDEIVKFLTKNRPNKIRIVLDILSPILLLNPAESVYTFLDCLFEEVKRSDAVLLATMEERLHPAETTTAMQQLFDGFLELSFHKAGLNLVSLFRIGKMPGFIPSQQYYELSFSQLGIKLDRLEIRGGGVNSEKERELDAPKMPIFKSSSTERVFDYLVKSFSEDYSTNKLAIEQAGWRTRLAASEATAVALESFYGKEGHFGPILKELLSSGLVEARFFSGHRGRGGEAIKIRVAYEKELVRRIVENVSYLGEESQ